MSIHTIKTSILKQIRENGEATAANIAFSNANQYLIDLEREGLITRVWVESDGKRFKLARINPKRMEDVKKYIGEIVAKTPQKDTATSKNQSYIKNNTLGAFYE